MQKCRSRSKCIVFLGVQIDTIEKTEKIVKTNITIASSSCLRQVLKHIILVRISKKLKWGAPSWLFHPISARGSIGTTTMRKMRPTLVIYLLGICFRIYSSLLNERWSSRSCEDDGAPCCDVLPESGPGQIECSCVVENQEINHIIKRMVILSCFLLI